MTSDLPPVLASMAAKWGISVWYIDAEKLEWRVRERDAQHDPGALSPSCLVFDSVDAIRRVWTYPSNWRTLDDATLEALSWGK